MPKEHYTICPKCFDSDPDNAERWEEEKYCFACGTVLVTTRCIVCNSRVRLNHEFCVSCGIKSGWYFSPHPANVEVS